MYPDFKNYDEYNHYILSYASNQDVAELEKKIDDVQKDQEGQSDIPLVDGKIPASYLPSNMVTTGEDGKITVDKLPESVVTVGDDGTIPSSKLPSYVDDVVDVDTLPETGETGKIYITAENKQYRWTGSQFAEITSGGVVIGDVTGTAYDGGKGVALESRVTTVENKFAEYPTKGEMYTAVNAVDEKVTTLEGKAVTYSDFSYVPGGETEPVARKTIQLANYDSISGLNVAGNDAANLIMMSKWDKVDIGSPRYPVNLNGSEFTLNDNRDIAKVYETKAFTDLAEGAADDAIRSALGLDFEDLIEIIRDKNVIIVDRNSIGDYKACIHATGNISSGNGAANLMFFIGTTPTIYQIQYVSGTYALAVDKYEFAKKSDIPDTSNLATKDEIPSVEGLASTEYVDRKVAEIEVPDVSDLKANVQTVGESVQIGQEDKGLNLKSTGNTYSGVMVNSVGYVPTMTPYPGEDGRYVFQMRNHDSLSGVGTDGVTGGNLAMLSKFDVADFGSKNFHTNFNVKADNGHNGRVTVNDDNEVAYLSDIPDTSTFVTETALEDYAKKDEILNTVVDESKNEKLSQALPVRTLLPVQRTTDVTNKSEAAIFSEYFNPKVTDRGSLRTYLRSNIAYISYNFESPGMKIYQYYKLPITMADIPDTGDIKINAVGADINNNNVITKFTFTITLNGDASSVHIEKKQLE